MSYDFRVRTTLRRDKRAETPQLGGRFYPLNRWHKDFVPLGQRSPDGSFSRAGIAKDYDSTVIDRRSTQAEKVFTASRGKRRRGGSVMTNIDSSSSTNSCRHNTWRPQMWRAENHRQPGDVDHCSAEAFSQPAPKTLVYDYHTE